MTDEELAAEIRRLHALEREHLVADRVAQARDVRSELAVLLTEQERRAAAN